MLSVRSGLRPILRSALSAGGRTSRGHVTAARVESVEKTPKAFHVPQRRMKAKKAAGQLTLPSRKRMLLPDNVKPTRYDITLEPDMKKFTFSGNVVIDLKVLKSTKVIEFHAKELKLSKKTATITQNGKVVTATAMSENKKDNVIRMTLSETVARGDAKLSLQFKGMLNDQMAGFYRSSYKDDTNDDQIMATTQFEAIDARRCYPCWDEPGQKAIFAVTIIHDPALTAISNMPVSESKALSNGKASTSFLPSPIMSTYLLAFCLGKFEYIQQQTSNGTLVRCLCVPGKDRINQMDYAMKVAVECLEFYNKYFGLVYPLPKLDMIAIPDFSAGAMENWGLITYREVLMLVDEKKAAVDQLQRVATVVTHEIAHQWFGNLVTMQWWDGLWLNEGFANWMQTYSADALFPEWNIWEQYVSQEQTLALRLDSLRSSHPIEVDIYRAETVEEVFDHISYSKGGCIVRLVYSLIGPKAFQSGLRAYLTKHSFSNTESSDLWESWEQAAKDEGVKMPLTKIMSTWTHQMGYPLLSVTESDKKGQFEVSQSWFLSDGSKKAGDEDKLWFVPLVTNTSTGAPSYLSTKSATVSLNKKPYLKLNYGQTAPLRVRYSPSLLTSLCDALLKGTLPAVDRIGLLSDYEALATANQIEITELVTLLKMYTKTETNDKVWEIISASWRALLDRLEVVNPESHTAAKKTLTNLLKPQAESLGWSHKPQDTANTKRLRSLVVSLYSDVSADAGLVKKAGFSLSKLPKTADMQSIVMKAIVRHDTTPKSAQKLRELYLKSDDNTFKNMVHAAVAKSPLTEVLSEALQWGLTSGDVRTQDYIYIVANTSMNHRGSSLTTAFIKKNYATLYNKLGKTSMMLFGSFAKVSFRGCGTAKEVSDMKSFWEGKRIDLLRLTIQQSVEGSNLRLQNIEQLRQSEASRADYWKSL